MLYSLAASQTRIPREAIFRFLIGPGRDTSYGEGQSIVSMTVSKWFRRDKKICLQCGGRESLSHLLNLGADGLRLEAPLFDTLEATFRPGTTMAEVQGELAQPKVHLITPKGKGQGGGTT